MNAYKIFYQRITKTISSSQCQHKEVYMYKCNYIRVDCSNYVNHHVLIHLGKCVGGGGVEKKKQNSHSPTTTLGGSPVRRSHGVAHRNVKCPCKT